MPLVRVTLHKGKNQDYLNAVWLLAWRAYVHPNRAYTASSRRDGSPDLSRESAPRPSQNF